MDVEYSPFHRNADEHDNRERCEKRKRDEDNDPNEREFKKVCNEVQSMVISETSLTNVNYQSNGFPVSANIQSNSKFQFPSHFANNFNSSFSSPNKPLSQNYPSPLPSHFYNSDNHSSNSYPSNINTTSNSFYQTKAESVTIDTNESMYMSSIIIFVRTLTGRILEIEANPQDTVMGLKERIQIRDGIPPSNQRLVYQGKALSDSQVLYSYVFN